MKKFLGVLFVTAALLSVVPAVHAGETKDLQGIFEECGIGALLFPEWTTGASVSNVIWDLGTTASTSGLTTPDACKGDSGRMASYIYESYNSIEQDLAKGDGKYLDMLALLSEKSLEEKEIFLKEIRSQFRDVVTSSDYSSLSRLEKAKLVYSIVQNIA